ncbi:MAG: hypothetical protein SPH22_06005 [Prevotella sp.]|nr:hypothetical protein [Prevotella sp.]MDY5289185.1 hypothetical protein [Prevotella sp.]
MNIKQTFFSGLLSLFSCFAAWGGENANVTLTKSDDGKTLTITASGDITNYSKTIHETSYSFNSTAVGNVFTLVSEGNYQSVTEGTAYVSSSSYYKEILGEKTEIQNFINQKNYFYTSTEQSWTQKAIDEAYTYMRNNQIVETKYWTNGIPQKVYASTPITNDICVESSSSDKDWDLREYVDGTDNGDKYYKSISGDDLNNYITTTTTYTASQTFYYSTDGGSTLTKVEKGQTFVYNESYKYYTVASSTYEAYTDDEKAAWVTNDNSGFITTAQIEKNMTFVQMLEANMKSGSYEKIVFVKADGAESLIITPEIANTLVYPDGSEYSSLNELDLQATTITTFEGAFVLKDNYNNNKTITHPNILRLPSSTQTTISSGHLNFKSLNGLTLLDISTLSLTNDAVGYLTTNNESNNCNVLDVKNLDSKSLKERWGAKYFNVFSPKETAASEPSEINVFVRTLSTLDLVGNASGYVNVVVSSNDGNTIGNVENMKTFMTKVKGVKGIKNLVLAKVATYGSQTYDITNLTNNEVIRIIMPDNQNLETVTNASHKPILQSYISKTLGWGTNAKNIEVIKVFTPGYLAKISSAHYYSSDIDNAYWQEYHGTLNADDIGFLENVKNDRLNLANATYPDDKENEKRLHQFSNDNIEYLAWPDFGTEPTEPLYNDLFANCKNLKAVGQYVSAKTKLNVNTEEEGAVRYITEMLSGLTNQNRNIKYAKISGTLKAEDIFASGNNAKIDADGHAYFTPEVDEYAYSQTRTMGAAQVDGETLSDGALNNVNLIALDLSDATFSHIEDMTLSALNILGPTAKEVKIPTDKSVTELPADFLNFNGCTIDKICIPGNIKKIHARAFYATPLKYIWTTGDDANVKYDNGAKYLLSDNTTLSDTYEDGATMKYGTFTFSPNLEFIGSYAFGGSINVHDVYMLGRKAPVCLVDAFSTVSYVANNSYMTFDGTVNREAYKNTEYAFMTVLHFPSTCTDDEAKLYTDITREYSIASDEMDDKGKTVYYPTQAEWNRSFVQGTTGYLWNAYCAVRNGLSGSAQCFYESSKSETGINISYETGKSQSGYQTSSNEYYKNNDYAGKAECVFYNTDITTTEGSETLEYDETLYDNDYRGWHQFVLTSYSYTGKTPTYKKDFSDFKDNEWWTICEPFPMKAEELKKVFGEEVKLVKLVSVTRNVAGNAITLNFGKNLVSGEGAYVNQSGYTMEAGVPYLIKPALAKEWTVDSRVLEYTQNEDNASRFAPKTADQLQKLLSDGKYTVDAIVINNTGDSQEQTIEKDGHEVHKNLKYTMIGTFYLHYMPKYCYFLGWDSKTNSVTFYWKNNDVQKGELSWNPYTAVIVPNYINQGFITPSGTFETVHYAYSDNGEIGINDDYKGTTTSNSKRMALSFDYIEDDDSVTSIENIHFDGNEIYGTDIYNINGQLVRKNSDASNLSKGIYIINGKKHIVK